MNPNLPASAVNDSFRKLAKLHDETCDSDPEHWYMKKFKKRKADYSDLLDELDKTPAERQQLLRGYWEPNDLEREEGKKKPTAAHRAIAALARTVRGNATIDWTLRKNVRARLRVLVKRILRTSGCPPDKQEKAARTVLEQAEAVSADWAAL